MKILMTVCLTILPWCSWCCKGKDPAVVQFKEFISTFNKTYNGTDEYQKRYDIFAENLMEIARLNKAANGKTKYKINEYSDMSWPEFQNQMLIHVPPPPIIDSTTNYSIPIRQARMPSSVDWRQSLPPVKNQGRCGSCWAFSTTAVVEAAIRRRMGRIVSLSEQELVDCAGETGNQGCNGGWPPNALKYIEKHGISTEASYSYFGSQGICSPRGTKFKVSGVTNLPHDEEAMMNHIVTQGPIAVAIRTGQYFSMYGGYMMPQDACSSTGDVDHAVTVVGFATSGGVPYWLVRNSWGPSWGDQGHFRAPRGVNFCGITTAPVGVLYNA